MDTVTAAFVIPLWADLAAIGLGAVMGATYAAQFRDRRLDLLGVAIVGISVGLGGGVLRDLLLDTDIVALRTDWFLPTAVAASLVGMLLERVLSRLGILVNLLDALTLGVFGAIGTTKALAFGFPPGSAVFVGAVAAVGGSVLRDVLLNLPVALMHVGSLYAVAAVGGASVLALLVGTGVPVELAATIGIAVTFGIRVGAIAFGWKLPEQRAWRRRQRPEAV
jgi:uncharacterized membrane protein YeiH